MQKDITKVVVDYKEDERREVIGLAQEVWYQHYGAPRAAREQPRVDAGVKRKRSDNTETEVGFLRKTAGDRRCCCRSQRQHCG